MRALSCGVAPHTRHPRLPRLSRHPRLPHLSRHPLLPGPAHLALVWLVHPGREAHLRQRRRAQRSGRRGPRGAAKAGPRRSRRGAEEEPRRRRPAGPGPARLCDAHSPHVHPTGKVIVDMTHASASNLSPGPGYNPSHRAARQHSQSALARRSQPMRPPTAPEAHLLCSEPPIGPERGALAARMPKRGAPTLVHSRRSHRL